MKLPSKRLMWLRFVAALGVWFALANISIGNNLNAVDIVVNTLVLGLTLVFITFMMLFMILMTCAFYSVIKEEIRQVRLWSKDPERFAPFESAGSAFEASGWRFAKLVLLKSGDIAFASLNDGLNFTRDENAACTKMVKNANHKPPEPDCTCGWYSLKSLQELLKRSDLSTSANVVLLCSYTGVIIPGKIGNRAQKQQVIQALVPNKCRYKKCSQAVTQMQSIKIPFDKGTKMESFCDDHVMPGLPSFTLADLRNQLGCEFVFV